MPAGKIASQAGHAYVGAIFKSLEQDPSVLHQYHEDDGIGTKVCLKSKNLPQLLRAHQEAKELGLPCFLVTDKGHILPPHFTGDPIITALGIGPAYRHEVNTITKRFNCV